MPVIRRARPLLGTLVVIEVTAARSRHATRKPAARREDAAIDAAFAAIAEVHRLMGFHDPGSDISRLNRTAPGNYVELHPWTVDVLAFALALAGESGHAFDCTIGRHLVRDGHLPTPATNAAPPTPAVDDRPALVLDGLRACRTRDVLVDLGGIAKGYAVDRAIDVLAGFDLDRALVNAGGDLRHAGTMPATVHLRHPADPGRVAATLSLCNMALASSVAGGLRPDSPLPAAIIDPQRNRPLPKGRGASVVAPACMLADALTKVVLVSGNRDHPLLARYAAATVFAEFPSPG